jgi:glycosyltransferase involved in cell wall biosynthesis
MGDGPRHPVASSSLMQENQAKNSDVQKLTGGRVPGEAPLVSIITPAYNIAGFVAATLDSVLAQTFKDFEIIVINDGSPDTKEFEAVLQPYLDGIVYLKQENRGAGAARNVAIEHSRGELLAFLDGDDIWLPEFLESQVCFLRKGGFDLVYSDALMFGMPSADGKRFMDSAPSDGGVDVNSILDFSCNVITSGTVARRQAVARAGMFEWEKVRAHDFHLWLRMLKNGARIGYQKKVLLKYRVHLDSLSGNSVERVQREIDVFDRVRKTIDLDDVQKGIVDRQVAGLKADLDVEQGKSFLLSGDFSSARAAFEKANRYRGSFKLGLIIRLIGIAPRLLLKFYRLRRAGEIALVPNSER